MLVSQTFELQFSCHPKLGQTRNRCDLLHSAPRNMLVAFFLALMNFPMTNTANTSSKPFAVPFSESFSYAPDSVRKSFSPILDPFFKCTSW